MHKAQFSRSVKFFVRRAHFCFFEQSFKHKKFSACHKKLPAYIKETKKTLGVQHFLRYQKVSVHNYMVGF